MFKEEIRAAEENLQKAGYYVANMMQPHNDHYELYNGDGECVMDCLTVSQLMQLAELLNKK